MEFELVNYCEFDKYASKAYSLIHNEPDSKNLGDITLVNEKEIADFNMMVGGSPCFRKGTKVITQSGYKNIEDIKIGDYVLTHRNRFKKVLKVGSNKNQLIYSLKAQGILEIKATGNHPFYVKTRNIKYHHNYREYFFSEPYKKELKDISKGDYIGVPILNTEENKYNLTKEMCWLLGRYVADGYLNNYKRKDRPNSYNREVIITVGKDKIEYFNKKMKNFKYNIYKKTKSCWQCVFRDKEIWNFINDNNFGKYANEKNIPQFIINLPIDLLEEFINGYIAGDGCKIKGYYQAITVSQELAMNLCLCIQKVYRTGCRIYYTKRPKKYIIEGREVNQQDTYLIRYKTEETKQKQYYIEDNIVWYPVTKVASLNYYEDVFNIEVKTDHTYTANNAITFNCQDFSVAGKGKGAVWTCKDCKDDEGNDYQYNPLEVHYTKRDKCPKCNSTNIEKTRSSLVVEWLRILHEKKPNLAMYENVKNLVGKKHKHFFDLFIAELHEYGYNTYWKVLNAKDYGIPQNRERVYLIIIKKELDNGKFKFPEGFDNGIRLKDILEKEVDEKYYISQDKVDKLIKQLKNKHGIYAGVYNQKDGFEERDVGCTLDACYYKGLGNNQNRNAVLKVGSTNPSGNGMNGYVYSEEGVAPTVTTNKGEENKIFQIRMLDIKGKEQVRRVYDPDGLSPTLNSMQGGNRQPKIIEENELKFVGGIDTTDKWIDNEKELSRNYKEGYRVYDSEGISCCQKYNGGGIGSHTGLYTVKGCSTRIRNYIDQPVGNTGGYSYLYEINYRIRKLIPLECFRLMGFQDKDYYILENNKISNSQCYKMAGNSIVVDVLYYILLEIYKAMPYLLEDIKLGSFFSGIGAFEKAIIRLQEDIENNNINSIV